MIGVPMLDGHANRLLKGDGALDVPAVEAPTASQPFRINNIGRAVVHVVEGLAAKVPGAVVVVLGSGAIDGGHRVAVDEDHIVALAEPLALVQLDSVGHSH